MNEKYIGDGVYLSFDGYQLWLSVNEKDNKVVALEPEVFCELIIQGIRIYKDQFPNFAEYMRDLISKDVTECEQFSDAIKDVRGIDI